MNKKHLPNHPSSTAPIAAPSYWLPLVAALALAAVPLNAATFTWTGGGANTLFSNPENWGETVLYPGVDDTAIFQWNGNAAVSFSGSPTTAKVQFFGTMDGEIAPTLNMDLGGFTYNATSTFSTDIFFPNGTNSPRTVTLQNGTLAMTSTQYFAHGGVTGAGNGQIFLRVQDGGILNLVGNTYIAYSGVGGDNVTATFVIENGGVMNQSSHISVGNANATYEGNLNVVGIGSQLNVSGTRGNWNKFHIATSSATGNVSITDGGYAQSNLEIGIGLGTRSVGTLTVSGGHFDEVESVFTASTLIGNDIYIGGASPLGSTTVAASGTGFASFLDGGTGQFTTLRSYFREDAYFDDDLDEWVDTRGTLTIDGGFVSVSGTATLFAGSVTELGVRTTAQDMLMTVNNLILDSTLQLIIAGDFVAAMNDEIHLIEYTSLTGTFAGLSEGATIHHDGHSFTIHYAMGLDSNVIGLTVIPEPATIALLTGALAALLVLRRRR